MEQDKGQAIAAGATFLVLYQSDCIPELEPALQGQTGSESLAEEQSQVSIYLGIPMDEVTARLQRDQKHIKPGTLVLETPDSIGPATCQDLRKEAATANNWVPGFVPIMSTAQLCE